KKRTLRIWCSSYRCSSIPRETARRGTRHFPIVSRPARLLDAPAPLALELAVRKGRRAGGLRTSVRPKSSPVGGTPVSACAPMDAPQAGPAGGPKKQHRLGQIFEWLTLSQAISKAEERERAHARERELVRAAGAAVHTADRLLDPPDVTAREPLLAFVLLREAAFWTLRARYGDTEEADPETLVGHAKGDVDDPTRLPESLADSLAEDSSRFAQRPPSEQLEVAQQLRAWVRSARDELDSTLFASTA